MTYTGVYINLDRSVDRRVAMEAQISRYGLQDFYRRLSGAEGNTLGVPTVLTDAETGCMISHYLACKQHLDRATHLHIVEDDVIFSGIMHKVICEIIASPLMTKYDVLFLESVVTPFATKGRDLRSAKELYESAIVRNARGTTVKVSLSVQDHIAGSTSYLVNGHSIPKLLSLYEQRFKDGLKLPVDIMMRNRQVDGILRIGCLFPFLTSVRLDDAQTTIADRGRGARSMLAMKILRHSFFVDRDIAKLLELANAQIPAQGDDQHHQLLKHIFGFYLSSEFEMA